MPWEHKFVGPYDRVADVHKTPLPLRDFLPRDDSDRKEFSDEQIFKGENAFKKAGLKLLKACDEKLWTERLSTERKAAVRKWTSLVSSEPMAWEVAIQHFCQGSMIYASGALIATASGTHWLQRLRAPYMREPTPFFGMQSFVENTEENRGL